jgi:Flp pilus assembly pilin Flp
MRKEIGSLIGNRNGATFVGYGLIVGLVALAAVAVATSVGPSVGGFTETGTIATATHSAA